LTLRPHTTLSAREQGVPGLALDGLHEVLAQLDGVHIEGDVGVGAIGEIVGQAPGVDRAILAPVGEEDAPACRVGKSGRLSSTMKAN
jgi:hypothetical protein